MPPVPSPPLLPLILFLLTYMGLALGRVPPLRLDRTGFAVLGAVAFLATGSISVDEAKAAVDAPTLVVLFGMMLLSAQYRLSGLYTAIGVWLAGVEDPRRLLLGTILVTALLSAVLTNDVTCFALTPLLASALVAAGRNPLPYLLALACASNIGSALTPIGNPQNILIAQGMELRFLPFLLACAGPVLLALGALYLLLVPRVRGAGRAVPAAAHGAGIEEAVPLDRWQAAKAITLTAAAIALFLSPVPTPLTALGVAGVVLTSRRVHTRDVLALVGLVVGNVPAVMLLLPFVGRQPETGWALALGSTFAGNAVLVGSIANLIVAEQAGRLGIRIGFREHLRTGLPVTLVSLAIAAGAMLLW
jgi:Na+/H+ antiporter NhaD/arsenite permease-like protein